MRSLLVTADAGWVEGVEFGRPVAVEVGDTRVTWAGPAEHAPAAPRRHVDGVLLPGLVDHHVHTELVDPRPLLAHGLTTVRDLGASTEIFSSQESADGPRVLAAGPFLTAVGGYPVDRRWATPGMAWQITDPDTGAEAVRELAQHRPTTVKVALNSDAPAVLDTPTLNQIVHSAHSLDLTVTAHVEGSGEVHRAVGAGVDELAHTPFTERVDDSLMAELAATTTLVSTLDIHGWGAETEQRAVALDNLRRFHRLGGRIRYGTDLGNGPLPESVNQREISALGEAGLSGSDILRAITEAPVTSGARADLVIVAGDPLADPTRLCTASPLLKAGRSAGLDIRKAAQP